MRVWAKDRIKFFPNLDIPKTQPTKKARAITLTFPIQAFAICTKPFDVVGFATI